MKNISIVNRTYEKSIFLKKRFSFLNVLEWKALKQEISSFDIIINATSLGLKNGDDFEFNFDNIRDNLIYIDTIYNPLETKMIKDLKSKGIKTFNGLDMLIYQALESIDIWFRKKLSENVDLNDLKLHLKEVIDA